MRGIVVGVDGSEGAAVALRWALAESHMTGRPLTAVMAWGLLDQHHAVIAPEFDADYGEAAAATALKTFVHEALAEEDFDALAMVAINGLPAQTLLEAATDADMLVLGSRGLSAFKAALVGSIASQCLHHASVPTIVVHEEWTQPSHAETQRIVVGIDGSPQAMTALRWAAQEAKRRSAHLEIVTAWQVPNAAGYPYVGVGFDPNPFEQSARALLDDARASIDDDDLIDEPDRHAVFAPAVAGLSEYAKGADLLVVGSRGQGGFRELLLGSVPRGLSHHVRCPLAVVPGGVDQRDERHRGVQR